MNFKGHNNSGFTLVEVLIALVLISVVSIALLNLEGGLLQSTYRARNVLERILLLDTFLQQQHKDILEGKTPTKEQTVEDPPTKITYTTSAIAGGSALSKIENIVLETVQAQWTDFGWQRTELLVNIRRKTPLETGTNA